jgi:hypothetical protein
MRYIKITLSLDEMTKSFIKLHKFDGKELLQLFLTISLKNCQFTFQLYIKKCISFKIKHLCTAFLDTYENMLGKYVELSTFEDLSSQSLLINVSVQGRNFTASFVVICQYSISFFSSVLLSECSFAKNL